MGAVQGCAGNAPGLDGQQQRDCAAVGRVARRRRRRAHLHRRAAPLPAALPRAELRRRIPASHAPRQGRRRQLPRERHATGAARASHGAAPGKLLGTLMYVMNQHLLQPAGNACKASRGVRVVLNPYYICLQHFQNESSV